jgi:hypothetical protein
VEESINGGKRKQYHLVLYSLSSCNSGIDQLLQFSFPYPQMSGGRNIAGNYFCLCNWQLLRGLSITLVGVPIYISNSIFMYIKRTKNGGPDIQTRELKLYNSIGRRFRRLFVPHQLINSLKEDPLPGNSFSKVLPYMRERET